jgi:hypothetical protein
MIHKNGIADISVTVDLSPVKVKTDLIPNSPAMELTASDAASSALLAHTKIILFNSAIVHLFPDDTAKTVTLTAGNTNTFSSWTEIIDSASVKLSSKFSAASGYLGDLSINDNSATGDKMYILELAWGSAKTSLGRVSWPCSYRGPLPMKSRQVPVGELVYYRLMCSGANSATAKIGFKYFYE